MSSQKAVSHPRHARGNKHKKDYPTTDRGWGGAGAVGWGVLGAFGSHEKDTGAQVVRKAGEGSVKMVKNDKGLWVKVRVDDAPSAGRGRGQGPPGISAFGSGDSMEFGLQDNDQDHSDYDDREYRDRDRGRPHERERRRASTSRSRSGDRGRRSSPSRSRSRERGRDRPQSRSRDRDDGRRRRRSEERGERRAPRRHRSRSSSRGRDRRKGSCSRSSTPDRKRRDRSPGDRREKRRSGSGDRGRRERHDEGRTRGKEDVVKATGPSLPRQQADEPTPAEMQFTAAQLAERLCEVYNMTSSRRLAEIKNCFSADVKLLNLKTSAVVLEGVTKLRDSMPSDYAKRKAECGKRLLICPRPPSSPHATFCLDLYAAGQAPGMTAFGKGGVALNTALLYRVDKNRITKVWIAPDREGLSTQSGVTLDAVRKSKLFAPVAKVVEDELGGSVECDHTWNDYSDVEVWG